jgi:phosphoenolpyruvate---glycerone phosphotransferase subunit DhaL
MLTVVNTVNWLKLFVTKINEKRNYLNELDSAIGDGDHGSNMVRGVTQIEEKLQEGTFTNVQDVLKVASVALISKVGGASGPLYGSAFLGMAKQASSSEDDIVAILRAGLKSIEIRGKASPGEKTMVDVWIPVIEAIENGLLSKQIIQDAVLQTKKMKATKGRASYLGERSVGHIDPGAASSGYLFETMLDGGVLDE